MEDKNGTKLEDRKINPTEYFSDLIMEFPILKNGIETDYSGMVHFQMEVFSDYNLKLIKSKNYTELKRCFEFQESRIEKLNSDLLNAINVSYCESLLLGECAQEMTEILNLMPPKLKNIYVDYEEYYKQLAQSK